MNTIFKRELLSYFYSPIAYIFLIVFVLVNCGLYMMSFFLNGILEMRSFFNLLPFILIVFVPAITMRTWAEEKRTGTIELLLTFPMSKTKVLFGKYLACMIFFALALFSTWTIPGLLNILGSPDNGQILSGYLGSFLMGCFILSIGMFISGLFKDQISAFILSIVLAFTFYIIGTDFVATFNDGWLPGFGTFIKNYVGISNHLNSFEKGVINVSDIYYFISYTFLFLVLNQFTLTIQTNPLNKSSLSFFSFIFAAIILASNMITADFASIRYDWTKGKIHTVSPATKSILNQLKVPITISFYVSDPSKMPTAMKNLRRDVLDKLYEIQTHSNSNVRIEVIDPSENESLANELAQRGIKPFQVQSIEEDSLGVKLVYATIILSYLDKKEEMIAQIHPGRLGNLEYELVSKIYRLTLEKIPQISISAPFSQMDPRLAQLMQQMGQRAPKQQDDYENIVQLLRQENYQVNRFELSENQSIDPNTDTLIVLSPNNASPRFYYELDQFLKSGKNLVLIDQAQTYQYAPSPDGSIDIIAQSRPNALNNLIKYWGVSINDQIYMDSNYEILSIPTEQDIGGFLTATVEIPIESPNQIKILPSSMNHEISITSGLGLLLYMWGSSLNINIDFFEKNDIQFQSLFKGSEQSWSIPFKASPLTDDDMNFEIHQKTPYPYLAIWLEGKFPSLYSYLENAPEWNQKDPIEAKPNRDNTQTGRLVIIGCSEMFKNHLILAHNNAHFLLNLVDALTLGEELIQIRSKDIQTQYINHVPKIHKLFYRILIPLFMPLFWIIFGSMITSFRKKRREKYYHQIQEEKK